METTNPSGKQLATFPDRCPDSPIFAILSPTPRSLAAHCQSAGFIVRPVVAPTVPAGTERVRVCLHAGNTAEEIDKFVECVKQWMIKQTTTDFQPEQLHALHGQSSNRSHPELAERSLLAKI